MSGRRLSAQERALWRGIARSVRPLPGAVLGEEDTPAAPPDPRPETREAPPPPPRSSARAGPPPQPPRPVPLGRQERRQLARGSVAIDARIDLHGMTQVQAHAALTRFLRRAQADGARTVLVVTGKGRSAGDSLRERGVLRRQVPLWLELPEFLGVVVGFTEAHIGHGGEGALYVRLRRARG